MNILKPFKVNKLAEICQQKQTRYAHAVRKGDDIIQVHQECLCRDFLGDVVIACKLNESYSIYGMSYNPSTDTQIDLNVAGFLIYFPNNEDLDSFKQQFNFLTLLEQSYKIPVSKYEEVKERVIFVEGSGWWFEETYRISFYTFVLRCLAYKAEDVTNIYELFNYIAKNYSTNEKNYITGYSKYFTNFVKNLPNEPQFGLTSFYTKGPYSLDDKGIGNTHNYSGFYTFLGQRVDGDV